MRKLTYKGFLRSYVQQLSECGSLSVQKLAAEAKESNPRLREPLFLYALEHDKIDLLLHAPDGQRYIGWATQYSKDAMRTALESDGAGLDRNFYKVWKSYLSLSNKTENDNHTKELMRSRILELQKKNRVTNYCIYTALKLNPGNVNAWLKHGDCSKLSLDAARRVYTFVRETPQVL